MQDHALLQIFRTCRADFISALSERSQPPCCKTLRELADLQLAIMAMEAAIAEKGELGLNMDCTISEIARSASIN